MHLYYTMILLYLRTIVVAIIFLVLPFVISAILTFFTILSVQLILLTVFSVLSFGLFIIIVHLNSTLEIFVEATWYEAYQLCKKEDAEYDSEHGADGHRGGHSDAHDDHGKHDDRDAVSHDNHGHH